MKLLFVNYEFPPLGGGGGRANANIARAMAAGGHRVTVMTSSFKGLPSNEFKDGYRILRISTWRRYLEKCRIFEMIIFILSSLLHSFLYVRDSKPDHVIAFFTIPSGVAALFVKWCFGIPYTVSLRGGDVPGFMKQQLWIYHWLMRPLIRLIWWNAENVVANSQGLKELALESSRDLSIQTIPNGVDGGFFSSSRQPRRGFHVSFHPEEEVVRFLTVGRLSPQKGLPDLISAFTGLLSEGYPAQLWIVGDGPERNYLTQMVRELGIEPHVTFFGWQPQDRLRDFYEACDVFVLASHYEGMANVLLEAMASGLPVISTEVQGARELIVPELNGYLVPIASPVLLKEAMALMIDRQSQWPDMARESSQQARRFEWPQVAESYLNLVRSTA